MDPQADGAVREGCEGTAAPVMRGDRGRASGLVQPRMRKPAARNAGAVALKADQAGAETRSLCSTKPANGTGRGIRAACSSAQTSAFVAGPGGLGRQPARPLLREGSELASALRHCACRSDRARVQMLGHSVARPPRAPGDLADRQSLSQAQLPGDVQKSHVDQSVVPRLPVAKGKATRVTPQWKSGRYPGQFRVDISRLRPLAALPEDDREALGQGRGADGADHAARRETRRRPGRRHDGGPQPCPAADKHAIPRSHIRPPDRRTPFRTSDPLSGRSGQRTIPSLPDFRFRARCDGAAYDRYPGGVRAFMRRAGTFSATCLGAANMSNRRLPWPDPGRDQPAGGSASRRRR